MIRAVGEMIIRMTNAKMFFVADIDQPAVVSLVIRMNNCLGSRTAPDYGLQSASGAIRDNRSVNTSVASEDADDDRSPSLPATAFPPDAASTEIAFIDFDPTKGRGSLAFFRDSQPGFQVGFINRFARQTGHLSTFACPQIKGRLSQNLTHFSVTNLGTPIVTV